MAKATEQTLVIRRADAADIPVIAKLAHDIWPGTYNPIVGEAQVKYMLDLFYAPEALEKLFAEQHEFLIAELNSEPVAFASYSETPAAGVYKVHKLYVHQAMQGKGLGKKLLDTIAENLSDIRPVTLKLNVNRNNPAKLFYEKCGFRVAGREDLPIGEGFFINDYIMEKSLSPYEVGQ